MTADQAEAPTARAQQLAPVAVPADYLIMTAAFRYALGRQSYIVGHVASWIERNADAMPVADAERIIREIDEHAQMFGLGMEMDAKRWRRVRERLRASLEKSR